MPRESRNTFTINGDHVTISHPDWDFIATATLRDDYAEEFQSVTWSKKANIFTTKNSVGISIST